MTHTTAFAESHEPVQAGLPLSAFLTRCFPLFQSVALDLHDLNDGVHRVLRKLSEA